MADRLLELQQFINPQSQDLVAAERDKLERSVAELIIEINSVKRRTRRHLHHRYEVADENFLLVPDFNGNVEAYPKIYVSDHVMRQGHFLSHLHLPSYPPGPIEDAIEEVGREYQEALEAEGISGRAFEIFHDLIDSLVAARLVQQQFKPVEVIAPVPLDPELEMHTTLSAKAFGKRVSLSDETVRNREREGALFSILPPGKKRGRVYPAFQSLPGIFGQNLREILDALGRPIGPSAFVFFTKTTDLLGMLTPVEMLTGRFERASSREFAERFASLSERERVDAVLRVAEIFAAS